MLPVPSIHHLLNLYRPTPQKEPERPLAALVARIAVHLDLHCYLFPERSEFCILVQTLNNLKGLYEEKVHSDKKKSDYRL